MNIGSLKTLLQNETAGRAWLIELQKYGRDIPALLSDVAVTSREEALARGSFAVHEILSSLMQGGMDFAHTDPGHGLGHVARDYVSAIRLLRRLDVPPQAAFIGFLGGVLHDSACTIFRRYDDNKSIVRHAGAAAIMLRELFAEYDCGLNAAEQTLVQYAVAAHTHYLKPMKVTCKDGVERELNPYLDLDAFGAPLFPVWLPRWIDRLDVNGPTFVARHYLTLVDTHVDYSKSGFYEVEYASHMRPLLRNGDDIKADGGKRTMVEHLKMFVDSQTNASDYGKHDFGAMVELRDALSVQTRRIIDAIVSPGESFIGTGRGEKISLTWVYFLAHNIEPHPQVGRPTVEKLQNMFLRQRDTVRNPWLRGFEATMREYIAWSGPVLADLDTVPPEWLRFLDIEDVRDLIRPHRSWASLY